MFSWENYHKINKILYEFGKISIDLKTICIRIFIKKMKNEDMFPCVCFLLSKKQIERSTDFCWNLGIWFKSRIYHEKECHSILREKTNFKEYLELPELRSLIKLFEKGIAIHHSGMIPVLRELVEIFFEKGYIKLLFATETFSVGLNMPIRTTIFTDIYKFDGYQKRLFYPHEFIQTSGRAGRRGKDKIGYVIHLFNLYNSHEKSSFRLLLEGEPDRTRVNLNSHIIYFFFTRTLFNL